MGHIETSSRKVASPEELLTERPASVANPAKLIPVDSIDADLKEAAENAEKLRLTAEKKKEPVFEVRFVKNTNPRELIVFKDGSRFKFPGTLHVCRDPIEAAKILEVAEIYSIVTQ